MFFNIKEIINFMNQNKTAIIIHTKIKMIPYTLTLIETKYQEKYFFAMLFVNNPSLYIFSNSRIDGFFELLRIEKLFPLRRYRHLNCETFANKSAPKDIVDKI